MIVRIQKSLHQRKTAREDARTQALISYARAVVQQRAMTLAADGQYTEASRLLAKLILAS